MSQHCHIVPWFNSEEWLKVYEELSNLSSSKDDLLRTLLVWKARCPSLPSGIESTLSLIQVHVGDMKQSQDEGDDQLLRLAYSSAIMRFVNHMLDTETVKGSSLYHAAKNLGVPDWIIDLRHDTAHSNNLPNITLLREACAICLQWLQQNYWEKYKPNILDYISGQKRKHYRNENNISVLMNLCVSLSICAHQNCKIKNLMEIPNLDMRESIVNDVKDLFGDQIDLSNLKSVSISSLINMINYQNKHLLQVPDVHQHVNEALLGDDAVFLSKELLLYFSANDFKHKNRLNKSYVQCFEALLTFLHTNDLLLEFLLALIKITQNHDTPYFKARLAALWVSEILMALKRIQEFSQKLQKMNTEKNESKKKKDLMQLFYHWFPNTKGNMLILDLQKPVPKQLSDINYTQPIIAAYNPYLIYFIRNLLNLIEPSIPNPIAERVYKLAELIATPEKFSPTASTIYTVDDLNPCNDVDDDDDDVEITEVIQPELDEIIQEEHSPEVNINGIWKSASKNHDWSSSPIGTLPWSNNKDNTIKANN